MIHSIHLITMVLAVRSEHYRSLCVCYSRRVFRSTMSTAPSKQRRPQQLTSRPHAP